MEHQPGDKIRASTVVSGRKVMAQKMVIEVLDDIDGGPADGTTAFGFDSRMFEIDLSSKNRAKLEKALQPFIDAGRRTSSARRKTSPAAKHDQRAVRAWGQENGFKVSERGRIPAEVTAAYEAAH
jgi:hypothetical protein